MYRIALPLTFLLAACGAQPAPEFYGAKRTDIRHAGRDYVVYQKGNRAEIIRMGFLRPGRHRATREAMTTLLEQVTGCPINAATLQGDSGEMRTTLRCPADPTD
ncbi:hypothetical protein [Falsigemmobacter faecalis]|uniref:Uncharacterized protein n=1 Tax=Falsigemmobacter faecalis TaxID=2488730 RepID=A0A3P3DKW7_9RHOB|nr:hypothetical protein [Falsigemmobacter faecalis]RRH74813.1 hypothetical protein EG244_09950 [Falsigemmobacter faecalis]